MSNYLQNFLCYLLFAENGEEHGSDKNALVTKAVFSNIVGFRQKWITFEWTALANLFYKVLNKTSNLSCLLKSNSILVYQLYEFVRDTAYNLGEISSDDDYDYLLPTVKIIKGDSEEDSILVQVTPMNVPFKVTV